MREKIIEMKNVTVSSDGRYRWQKMQNGKRYDIKERNPKVFLEKVRELKKALKDNKEIATAKPKIKDRYILVNECKKYLDLYKDGEHKAKLLGIWKNHMQGLTKDVREYLPDDMQKYRNGLSEYKKVDKQVILILNPVFNNFVARRIIPINPLTGTKSKASKSDKREWIHIAKQRIILENLFDKAKCKIGNELLFYFLTGSRCEEAQFVTPHWGKGIIFIDGTKTDNAPRYVKLSQRACNYFKTHWANMFKCQPHYYSKNTTKFLRSIGIEDKSLHCIRHSFSTNMFYLGATEAEHMNAMGHSDIKMTKNVYTKFDPTVNKDDILAVWQNWYPTDFDMSTVLKVVLNEVPKTVKNCQKLVS